MNINQQYQWFIENPFRYWPNRESLEVDHHDLILLRYEGPNAGTKHLHRMEDFLP